MGGGEREGGREREGERKGARKGKKKGEEKQVCENSKQTLTIEYCKLNFKG